MVNSNAKGKAGEREFAKLLRDHGWDARRGQQFSGSNGDPDVVHSIPAVHIEIKRRERFNLSDAMKQAKRDAKAGYMPIVAHRRNQEPWFVTLSAEDFLALIRASDDL